MSHFIFSTKFSVYISGMCFGNYCKLIFLEIRGDLSFYFKVVDVLHREPKQSIQVSHGAFGKMN